LDKPGGCNTAKVKVIPAIYRSGVLAGMIENELIFGDECVGIMMYSVRSDDLETVL
jgi:hypothetical protein